MNKQILRLSGVAMVLLAALIAATTYWQTWARADLAAKQDNAIQRVAQFSIRRGAIEAGGRLLAGEHPAVRRRASPLLPPLPARAADGARRRLLDRSQSANRPREVAQRLPDRLERRACRHSSTGRSTSFAASRSAATTYA